MKKQMFFCFTVDDVALNGWSTPEHLDNLVEFCNHSEIAATFFAVPENEDGIPIVERKEYSDVLRKILKSGHEIGQHGIRHERFEVGIPPQMVLELPHEGAARKFLEKNRNKLMEELTVSNIRSKIEYGRKLLETAIECPVCGFRAPALQMCENMYQALSEANYQYDSTVCLQETGWDYINGRYEIAPREINRERFDTFWKKASIPVWPMTTDYTWFLTDEHYTQSMELAKHDFRQCLTAGIPFVTVCHVSPVQIGENNCGLRFWTDLLSWMQTEADLCDFSLSSVTLKDLTNKIKGESWN